MNDNRNPLVSGFVEADGKRVVNGDGQEILLQESGLAAGCCRKATCGRCRSRETARGASKA